MHRKNTFLLGSIIFGMVVITGCSAYMAGNIKLAGENYEEAIAKYQEALANNPDDWRARKKLGYAYIKTGQTDKAIDEFNRVLQQKPGESYATYYLGLAELQKGERDKTIHSWKSYRNKPNPSVEQKIKQQLTLVEMVESIGLAKQALADEQKLQTLPPKSGTVAVFYFKDISPNNDFKHLQKALAAMITTDLAHVKSLQVLERFRIQFLLEEMKLGQTGIVETQTAPRVGRLLGAENLIVGTIESGTIWVKTSVASTTQKDLLGSVAVSSEVEEFFKLEKEVVYRILNLLRAPFTPEEKEEFSKYHTKDLQAVIYYGQALEALDESLWKEARRFFKLALERDPYFDLARIDLESCPSANTPAVAALYAMPDSEFAVTLERYAGQSPLEIYWLFPEQDTRLPEKKEEETTGSITIKW